MLRPLSTHEKESVPIVQEAGWNPGPVWTGAENLAPSGITQHGIYHKYMGYEKRRKICVNCGGFVGQFIMTLPKSLDKKE
jgi:hypothetical protein